MSGRGKHSPLPLVTCFFLYYDKETTFGVKKARFDQQKVPCLKEFTASRYMLPVLPRRKYSEWGNSQQSR